MTSPDDIVSMELARLSAEFVAQLPEQLRAVETEFAAWLDAPQDSVRFEVLSHRVHQLKGSGSTFGCPGVSRAASALEEHIGAMRRDIDAGRLPASVAIETAMVQLQNEASRAQTQSQEPEASP